MTASPAKRIHFLSEQLANQIAAGEVVERPASVLKELLENALDAGATQIDVEVEKGGMVSLLVRDNGHGIHPQDMAMAISRHATSKIDTLEDLEALFSLGFRGEALASIGSVSRMRLLSCTAESEHAWSIEAEGRGSVPQEFPATHPVGSTVEVRELFFNTPARRRFLRSDKTEFNHLEDVFNRAALSRPQVGFSLSHNQRLVHRYRARQETDHLLRVIDVCGKAFGAELEAVEQRLDELTLHGWVSVSRTGRSSTDLQYFFLNGRMVRDKLIQHAIRQAYESILPAGRHAGYVLYMELPASEVDVNVHPTKHEVRFQQARKVHDFIVVALRRHLPQTEKLLLDTGEDNVVAEATAPAYRAPGLSSTSASRNPYVRPMPIPRPASVSPLPAVSQAEDRLLALIAGRYALMQGAETVRVLDTYVADASVIRQELLCIAKQPGPVSPLIFPIQVELTPAERDLLECLSPALSGFQINWEVADVQRVRITSAPAFLQVLDLQAWLLQLLRRLPSDVADNADTEALIVQMSESAMGTRRYPLNQTELGRLLGQLASLTDTAETLSSALWLTLDESVISQLMQR